LSESRAPGLRVQIVVALFGLMALAFLPLFFAVASLARATIQASEERAMRAVGRAVSVHVRDARAQRDPVALQRAIESHVGRDGIEAICIFAHGGESELCVGESGGMSLRPMSAGPYRDGIAIVTGSAGRAADIAVAGDGAAFVTRVRLDRDGNRGSPLVGLVAIYMATFGMALLTFAYFALTRLIVRPIDGLAQAADRVASGARTFLPPSTGAREISDLGASVRKMTLCLVAEEAAMRAKVDELTLTTKRLTEAREQLARSERLASVGRLAAGIAHEIGNPIAALMGMEDLLLDGDLSPETSRDFLERMKRETHRIHGVVHDLLDFARPEDLPSEAAIPIAPAIVRDVLNDVAALLRPQKAFKGLRVDVDIEGDEGKASTPARARDSLMAALPADKLTQVVLNLAMNAGDAIVGPRPSASAAVVVTGRVTLRAHEDGANVRIEVEDSGPGVPDAMVEQIFEPFVTTKEVGKGTGLGLAVCRGLVEGASGAIGIDMTYKEGARFYVTLPRPR
jgi:two-component system, NtrC family, sensor kinase